MNDINQKQEHHGHGRHGGRGGCGCDGKHERGSRQAHGCGHGHGHGHGHQRGRGRGHGRGMSRRSPEAIALISALEPKTMEEKLAGELRVSAHYLRRSGLNRSGQLRILQILAKNGAMSQRLLQDVLGVRPGSLSEMLGKLEAAGHITRSQNEADKRAVDLAITASGEEAVAALEADQEEAMQGLFAALDNEEQEQLSGLLGKLLVAWQGEEAAGTDDSDEAIDTDETDETDNSIA